MFVHFKEEGRLHKKMLSKETCLSSLGGRNHPIITMHQTELVRQFLFQVQVHMLVL